MKKHAGSELSQGRQALHNNDGNNAQYRMKLIFMGTPEFAATILEDLVQHHDVLAVYTRPDAVRGRGKEKLPSPVKLLAQKYEIPVFEPSTLRDETVQKQLASYTPDAICVAAYGMLLPAAVLEIPRFGCLNVHGSLLPSWRGAAPVEHSILADDVETGVCVMRMEEGLDTGDYCVCRTTNIEDKTAEELSDELANLGSHALLTALVHLQEGALDWTHQDEEAASYAPKIEKGELNIKPQESARKTVLKVRASSAAHPSKAVIAGRSVTVVKLKGISEDEHAQEITTGLTSGTVKFIEKRLFLGTNDEAIELLLVKPDGKQEMDARSFAAGIQGIKEGILSWEAIHV